MRKLFRLLVVSTLFLESALPLYAAPQADTLRPPEAADSPIIQSGLEERLHLKKPLPIPTGLEEKELLRQLQLKRNIKDVEKFLWDWYGSAEGNGLTPALKSLVEDVHLWKHSLRSDQRTGIVQWLVHSVEYFRVSGSVGEEFYRFFRQLAVRENELPSVIERVLKGMRVLSKTRTSDLEVLAIADGLWSQSLQWTGTKVSARWSFQKSLRGTVAHLWHLPEADQWLSRHSLGARPLIKFPSFGGLEETEETKTAVKGSKPKSPKIISLKGLFSASDRKKDRFSQWRMLDGRMGRFKQVPPEGVLVDWNNFLTVSLGGVRVVGEDEGSKQFLRLFLKTNGDSGDVRVALHRMEAGGEMFEHLGGLKKGLGMNGVSLEKVASWVSIEPAARNAGIVIRPAGEHKIYIANGVSLPSTGGLEERMERAKEPIGQIVQERQKLAVLMDPAAASYASPAELARVARRLRRLNGYPVIEIKPLSAETAARFQADGYQVVQVKLEPREPVADPNVVYVRLPAGTERLVPKKFLPMLVTDAVALWQKAKGVALSSPIILPAAPYLNARGISFQEIRRTLTDFFA